MEQSDHLAELVGVSGIDAERLPLLLSAIQKLASSFDIPLVLPGVADSLQALTGVRAVRIILRNRGGFQPAAMAGPLASQFASYDSAVTGRSGHLANPATDSSDAGALQARLNGEHPGTLSVYPLVHHSEDYGFIVLGDPDPDVIDPAGHHATKLIAGQTAISIHQALMFQHAQRGQQWLSAVLANTVDPVMVIDGHQHILLLNRAATDLFQLSYAEAIRQPLARVLHNHRDLLHLIGSVANWTGSEEWESPDGRIFAPHISPIETNGGPPSGYVLTLRDVTGLKLLNRNLAEFIRLVSHDLRSPLTFMQGYADLIDDIGPLNNQQQDFLEKILNGIQQIKALVDNIQDAGRWDPQTGLYEMSREPVDVTQMLREILANHQNLARENGVTLIQDFAPDIPILNADRLMLERALINLVTNAIKYSPNGGEVRASVRVADDAVVVCISDQGIGIPEDRIHRIFERGERVVTSEVKRHKIKGSGLGLFIVQSVAHRHNGKVWVESKPGRGSRFYLSIPLAGENLLVSQ